MHGDRRYARIVNEGDMTELTQRLGCGTEVLADFCRDHHIASVALFGSVLRNDFGPSSDIDVLVAFRPGCAPSLFGRMRLEQRLAELFGRRVDLVTLDAVNWAENHLLRDEILSTRCTVYAESP